MCSKRQRGCPLLSLASQPLNAQTSSDAERLQKLEQAVSQLQKRNAELEIGGFRA